MTNIIDNTIYNIVSSAIALTLSAFIMQANSLEELITAVIFSAFTTIIFYLNK